MIATFSFLALLHGQIYVLDYGLSAEDCATAVSAGVSTIQVTETQSVDATGAILYCGKE